jgi:hypothetical protein
MLDSLDTMISLGIIFLVLSMVLKFVMSMLKRFLKTKANVAAREMKVFIGKNTSQFLELYAKKQRHLKLLHRTKILNRKRGFRQLNKEELKEITSELRQFLEGKDNETIRSELGMDKDSDLIKEVKTVKEHLDALQNKAETLFKHTLRKIDEEYKKRIQVWTFISAFIIAALMNASFFDIYKSISTNHLIRKDLVSNTTHITDKLGRVGDQISSLKSGDVENIQEEITKAKEKIVRITNTIPEAKQLFGWEKKEFTEVIYFLENDSFNKAFNKLMGFLISALLMSFGAPFWHDYLESFINIRKTMAKNTRQDASKTNPPTDASTEEQED